MTASRGRDLACDAADDDLPLSLEIGGSVNKSTKTFGHTFGTKGIQFNYFMAANLGKLKSCGHTVVEAEEFLSLLISRPGTEVKEQDHKVNEPRGIIKTLRQFQPKSILLFSPTR